ARTSKGAREPPGTPPGHLSRGGTPSLRGRANDSSTFAGSGVTGEDGKGRPAGGFSSRPGGRVAFNNSRISAGVQLVLGECRGERTAFQARERSFSLFRDPPPPGPGLRETGRPSSVAGLCEAGARRRALAFRPHRGRLQEAVPGRRAPAPAFVTDGW